MFRPVCADMPVLIHHVIKLHPSLARLGGQQLQICKGCQRYFSVTRRQLKKWKVVAPHQPPTPGGAGCHWGGLSLMRCLGSSSSTSDGTPPDKQNPPAEKKPSAITTAPDPSKGPGSAIMATSQGEGGQAGQAGQAGQTAKGEGSDAKSEKVIKVKPRPRARSIDYTYTGNIYILPVRAMNEYLLKPSDLESLPKYIRRSPYVGGVKITMYLRSDVERVALKVWGSIEKLNREKRRIWEKERNAYSRYDVLQLRSYLDDNPGFNYKYVTGDEKPYAFTDDDKKDNQSMAEAFRKSGSSKVVASAIIVNGVNTLFKFVAWLYTGSHSMFSEAVHSAADTMNQIILGIGLYHSIRKPDPDHPYGYVNLRYISSLISGVGIFFFGTGLSMYHGFQGVAHPEDLTNFHWGVITLSGSLVTEGASLLVAIHEVRKSSKKLNMNFWKYVWRGHDPNVTVVLLEDLAAVLGVGVAGVCMGVSHYLASPLADAAGSLIIGGLLGGVASVIVYTNANILIGKSIPPEVKLQIREELEGDRMVRSLHDVKATEMGGEVRFKAEVDFDGREITRAYLYKLDLEQMLAEMHALKNSDEAETFMLNHGEKIIDRLGEEVDRIEKLLKERHPQLRHVDLEAL